MFQDPFRSEIPLAQRIAVTVGMGLTGFATGLIGIRELKLSWSIAIAAGIVGCALLAFVAWRSPELFFKNRP